MCVLNGCRTFCFSPSKKVTIHLIQLNFFNAVSAHKVRRVCLRHVRAASRRRTQRRKKIRETTTTTAGAERKKLGRKEKISKLFPTWARALAYTHTHTHTQSVCPLCFLLYFLAFSMISLLLSPPQSPFMCWHDARARAFFPSALSLIEFNTHRNRSRKAPAYPNKIPSATQPFAHKIPTCGGGVT